MFTAADWTRYKHGFRSTHFAKREKPATSLGNLSGSAFFVFLIVGFLALPLNRIQEPLSYSGFYTSHGQVKPCLSTPLGSRGERDAERISFPNAEEATAPKSARQVHDRLGPADRAELRSAQQLWPPVRLRLRGRSRQGRWGAGTAVAGQVLHPPPKVPKCVMGFWDGEGAPL